MLFYICKSAGLEVRQHNLKVIFKVQIYFFDVDDDVKGTRQENKYLAEERKSIHFFV